MLLSLAHKTIR